uniref:Uncharacterized protein n=1 Tax=Anguilla anguilla TaxID=7936 RepID=A0A0E9VPG9_ANGAN
MCKGRTRVRLLTFQLTAVQFNRPADHMLKTKKQGI